MTRKGLLRLGAAGLLCLPGGAIAKTTCTLTTTSVVFGAYNPIGGGSVDITGTVTLGCDKDTTDYEIQLSPGAGGSFAARRMATGSYQLPYQLYRDGARTIVWGDGTGGTSSVIGTLPNGQTSASFTVYGRVFGGANVAPGFFTDLIVGTAIYK